MADRTTPVEADDSEAMTAALREIIEDFDCTSGTLHRLDDDRLHLIAHVGIPDPVLERIEVIPIGKGMAGAAAERREPVEVCNLQSGDDDVAEDGARATGMEGSIAAPIIAPDDTLAGTIGIAKPDAYEFTAEERERLLETATQLSDRL